MPNCVLLLLQQNLAIFGWIMKTWVVKMTKFNLGQSMRNHPES